MMGGSGARRGGGPGFGQGNTAGQTSNDPGLLVLVKLLPREDAATTTPGGARHDPRPGPPGIGPGDAHRQHLTMEERSPLSTQIDGPHLPLDAVFLEHGQGLAGLLLVAEGADVNGVVIEGEFRPRLRGARLRRHLLVGEEGGATVGASVDVVVV